MKNWYLFHDWFSRELLFIYSISLIYKYLLELIKRRSKVQENNMPCEHDLNFDQWKTFSESYKPIRVWLCLVYKFAENNCRLQLCSEFIQTQKRYPTSLDKIRILTWKLLVISGQNSLWTELPTNLLLAKYLISVAATLSKDVLRNDAPYQTFQASRKRISKRVELTFFGLLELTKMY